MLFSTEMLFKQRICVNCPTKEESDMFLHVCMEQGYHLAGWDNRDVFSQYKEKTAYRMSTVHEIAFAPQTFYKDKGYKVISFADLIGTTEPDAVNVPKTEYYLDTTRIYDNNTVIEINESKAYALAEKEALELLYSTIQKDKHDPQVISKDIVARYLNDGRPFCINLSREDGQTAYALTTTYKRAGKTILSLQALIKQREIVGISEKYPTMQTLLETYKLKADDKYQVKLALNHGAMHETDEIIIINEIKEDKSDLSFTLLIGEIADKYWYSEMSVFQIIKKLN